MNKGKVKLIFLILCIAFLALLFTVLTFFKCTKEAFVQSALINISPKISGKILEINEEVVDSPELLNDENYSEKWLVKIESNAEQIEFSDLLDYSDYKEEIS